MKLTIEWMGVSCHSHHHKRSNNNTSTEMERGEELSWGQALARLATELEELTERVKVLGAENAARDEAIRRLCAAAGEPVPDTSSADPIEPLPLERDDEDSVEDNALDEEMIAMLEKLGLSPEDLENAAAAAAAADDDDDDGDGDIDGIDPDLDFGSFNWNEHTERDMEDANEVAAVVRTMDSADILPFARERVKEGNLHRAIAALEVLTEREMNNAEAWEDLGIAWQDADNDVLALPALERALDLSPDNDDLRIRFAICAVNNQEDSLAFEAFRELASRLPSLAGCPLPSVTLESELSDLSRDLGEYVKQNEARIDGAPDAGLVYKTLGVLYSTVGKYGDALEYLARACEKRPTDVAMINSFGAVLTNSGETGKAVEVFQRVLSQAPNFAKAHVNIGIAFMNLGKGMDATRAFARALQLNKKNEYLWRYMEAALSHSSHSASPEESAAAAIVRAKDFDGLIRIASS